MPQSHLWQQAGFNDVQLLQQHIIFKQLQEVQKQQQVPQLGNVRQQSSENQLPTISEHPAGGQFPPFINGTPVHNVSQMFMNWVQLGEFPASQGVPNGTVFSQEQGQTLHPRGRLPHHPDASFYGTPVAGARDILGQYFDRQGMHNDQSSLPSKASGNQKQKLVTQSSAFSNSLLGEQSAISPSQSKDMFDQVTNQSVSSENLAENFQQVNPVQRNAPAHQSDVRQDPSCCSGLLQEKSTNVISSRSSVALDPLEEKILFSTDDSTWDSSFFKQSFGNAQDQIVHSNSFPSFQGGSWSALMQSAMSEASSSDNGLQEEWSGLSFRNTEVSADNQASNFMSNMKQQICFNDINLQKTPSNCSEPFATHTDSSRVFSGFQLPVKLSPEQREGLCDPSHKSTEHSSRNSDKWENDCHNPQISPIERTHQDQSFTHLGNVWTGQTYVHPQSDVNQQNDSAYKKQLSKPRGKNDDSPSHAPFDISNNDNHADNCWRHDVNVSVYKGRDSDGRLWKSDETNETCSFSNSMDGREHTQSGTDSTLAYRNSQMNNISVVLSQTDPQINQEAPHLQPPHYMKDRDTSIRDKKNEGVENEQHSRRNNLKGSDSSYNRAGEGYVKPQSYHKSENFNASYCSIASQNTVRRTKGVNHEWSNASNCQPVAASFNKAMGQDFNKSVNQGMSSCEQLYFGEPKKIDKAANNSMELEKGPSPEYSANSKESEKAPSGSIGGSNFSISFNNSSGFYDQNISVRSSQNMLQLLHKVDQSNKDRSVTKFGSTGFSPVSEVSEEGNPDPYVAQLSNSHSGSQGFGLRLAPPLQHPPNLNVLHSSQNSPHAENNSLKSRYELGEPTSPFSLQSLPPFQQTGIATANMNMPGISPVAFTSGSPYMQSQFQCTRLSNASVSCGTMQESLAGPSGKALPFNLASSQDTSKKSPANPFSQEFPVVDTMPVTLPSSTSDMSQQGGLSVRQHNVWRSIPDHKPSLATEFQKGISASQSENNLKMTSYSTNQQGAEYGEEQPSKERFQRVLTVGLDSASQTVTENLTRVAGAASLSSVMTHAHSLPHDLKDIKDTETEPNSAASAQNKGVKSNMEIPQIAALEAEQSRSNIHNTSSKAPLDKKQNAASGLNPFPSGGKTLSFMSEEREGKTTKASSQSVGQDLPSREMVTFGQSDLKNISKSSNVEKRIGNSHTSLEMENSWFNRYRNLKKGQMLQVHDARNRETIPDGYFLEKPFQKLPACVSVEQINAANGSQVANFCPRIACDHLSTDTIVLPSGRSDQNLAAMQLKKRKAQAAELLLSHKAQCLQKISMEELNWAQATNRLVEKVDDETELKRDERLVLRPRKRLIFTTQLMQQLLPPAPATILSTDAISGYDSVAFSVARLALGDACSQCSSRRSDYSVPSGSSNRMSEKLNSSEGIAAHFSKIVENFSDRIKKLENDLLRMNNRPSIADIRVESQDLEKFSVMNRFAKFHSRPLADASETSSEASAPELYPQRYVTALLMPKTVPEGIHCLSL